MGFLPRMLRTRRKVLPALMLGAVAGASSLGLAEGGEDPTALELQLPDDDALPPMGFRSLPDVAGPPSPQAVLEGRLAALAASVEARTRSFGDAPVEWGDFDQPGLAAAITETLSGLADKAHVSVHVRDLDTNRVLFDYYGDSPLIPASNQKLLTSSAALSLLGSDYTFATRLYRSGNDLVLVGEGDPVFGSDDLYGLATAAIEQVELTGIERLVVDDTAFSPERFGPGYSSEGPGYPWQAPSGALSLDYNTLEVTVYPVKGQPNLTVEVSPPGAHVEIVNTATRGGRRSWLSVTTVPKGDKTVVQVQGRLRTRHRPVSVRRRIYDPALFTGHTFAQMLATLTTSEPLPVVRGSKPADAEEVLMHESVPLIEIVDSGLAYSNNFIAEQVLRTVAWRMTGDPGGWNAGQEILKGYWSAVGGDPAALVVENASGLSRLGRATTHGLVDLIAVAHRTAAPGERGLIDALPVAGEEGTLRSRLRLSGKRVRAKTGTMHGVSGLTGVITKENGDPQVAFSILINVDEDDRMFAEKRRQIEDKVVMSVLETLDAFEAARSGLTAKR